MQIGPPGSARTSLSPLCSTAKTGDMQGWSCCSPQPFTGQSYRVLGRCYETGQTYHIWGHMVYQQAAGGRGRRVLNPSRRILLQRLAARFGRSLCALTQRNAWPFLALWVPDPVVGPVGWHGPFAAGQHCHQQLPPSSWPCQAGAPPPSSWPCQAGAPPPSARQGHSLPTPTCLEDTSGQHACLLVVHDLPWLLNSQQM